VGKSLVTGNAISFWELGEANKQKLRFCMGGPAKTGTRRLSERKAQQYKRESRKIEIVWTSHAKRPFSILVNPSKKEK
jgi:hypothetical protein